MIAQSAALRRGFGLAVAAVLVTSGCAAGRDAQTANQVPTQDGTNAEVGSMALRGISLEPPTTTFYAPGSVVQMRLVLVNEGIHTDSLTNIVTSVARGWSGYRNSTEAAEAISEPSATATPTSSSASTSPAETPISIPAGQRVSFGVPDSKRVLVLLTSVGRIYPGSTVKITFTFARAGSVSVQVPVQLSTDPGDTTVSPGSSD